MEEKKVKEVMLSLEEYATVSEDATVAEALERLSEAQDGLERDRHRYRAILVLDREGKVVGKLTHWAVLRSLEPTFAAQADDEALWRARLNEDFVRSLKKSFSLFRGSLSRMCQEAARKKVRDAMVPAKESIDEEARLTDAIYQMVVGHWQSMLVTRKDKVVGIVRLSDVFEEVASLIRSGGGSRGADEGR
jgi:CBS domain-containing protein